MSEEKLYVSPEKLAYVYQKIKSEIPALISAEKGSIVESLIQELQGLPVFGIVDSDNTIKITSQLSAGVYTLKYENANEEYADVGNIIIKTNSNVGYSNLIDLTPTTDTEITTASEGWIEGYRISESEMVMKPVERYHITNIIPVGNAQILRIKNLDITTGYGRIYFYNDTTYEWQFSPSHSTEIIWTSATPEYTEINLLEFEKIMGSWGLSQYNGIRICGIPTNTKEDIIVTLDEEII